MKRILKKGIETNKFIAFFIFCFISLISHIDAAETPYQLVSDKIYRDGNTVIVASHVDIVAIEGYTISTTPDGIFTNTITINQGDIIPDTIYLKDISTGDINEGVEIEETIKFDRMISYGKPVTNNGITNYIDNDGTTSAEVIDNEIIWLKEEDNGTSSWFALDNRDAIFEEGSRFYVKFINESTESNDWNNYFNLIDEPTRNKIEQDKLWIMSIGVTSPNGNEYNVLPSSTGLYVKYPDNWDKNDIETLFISSQTDENISTEFINMAYPDGTENFLKLSLNHFSPYAIYDKLNETKINNNSNNKEELPENPNTFDGINNAVIIGGISLIGLLGSAIYLRKKSNI